MKAYCGTSGSLALFRVLKEQTDGEAGLSLMHVFPHREDLSSRDPLAAAAQKICFSPDGQFLALMDCASGVHLYDIDRSLPYPLLSHPRIIRFL